MVGEITGWSRLAFGLYLVMEWQFSWRVKSVQKTQHFYPASTRLSHRLQVCYWRLILRRSNWTHCKPEFLPFLSLLRRISCRVVHFVYRWVENFLQFIIFWSALRCLLVVLVTSEMVKEFSSTFCSEDPQESSANQGHFTQGQQAPYFNLTNPMSKNTQCMALGYPSFYMIVHE